MSKGFYYIFCATVFVALGGCAALHRSERDVASDKNAVEKSMQQFDKSLNPVSQTDAPWIMGDSVNVQKPVSPILKRRIAWSPGHEVSLSDLANYVTEQIGLPVDVTEVVNIGGNVGNSSGSKLSGLPMATLPPPTGIQANGLSMGGMAVPHLAKLNIKYDGDVKGLLDLAANESGIWWSFDNGSIEFYKNVTKTFYLPSINRYAGGSESMVSNTTSSQSGSGGTGGASGASAGSSLGSSQASSGSSGASSGMSSGTGGGSAYDGYNVNFWSSAAATVKAVAGGSAAPLVAVQPMYASITVTGTPLQVKNVSRWAKELTSVASQQVLISVTMYTIQLSGEDNNSWSPSLLFKKMAQLYSLSLAPGSNPVITGSTTAGTLTATAGSKAALSGSSVAVTALSTIGHISSRQTEALTSMNGQPVHTQIVDELTYLASTETELASNVGSTSQLTPGVAVTGFTGKILPQIVNGRVMLSVDVTNSTLVSIDTDTSNGSSISTPNIQRNAFDQTAYLKPGEEILLTGIQQNSVAVRRNGQVVAKAPVFGGGVDNTHSKNLIALVISATVI